MPDQILRLIERLIDVAERLDPLRIALLLLGILSMGILALAAIVVLRVVS